MKNKNDKDDKNNLRFVINENEFVVMVENLSDKKIKKNIMSSLKKE